MTHPSPPPPVPAPAPCAASFRRSGAVARMLRMPVATLRVWERRYALTQPKLSASGQRLYSPEDVQRLTLVKQLTDLGHAIGSLAPLDMAQLQAVATTHANTQTLIRMGPKTLRELHSSPPPRRLAVIGAFLGARMTSPTMLRHLAQHVQLLGPFDTLASAAATLDPRRVDAVLIHEPQLHAGWLAGLESSAPTLVGIPKAVLYGYASDAVCESLVAVGIRVLREPQPDVVIAHWLNAFAQGAATPNRAAAPRAATERFAPPRWDEGALRNFVSRSTTVTCECPGHVADLLVQLARFERYSAECAHRNAADVALHRHLQHITAQARARFEEALERVAEHEGWPLPGP